MMPAALPGFEGVQIGSTGKRRDHDYYATPAWATDAMLPFLIDRLRFDDGGRIIEPGCGHGAIAIPLAKLGFEVLGLDIRPEAVREVNDVASREMLPNLRAKRIDFLRRGEEFLASAAVGNPPFSHAQEFVEVALGSTALVCFLLPLSFLATTGRIEFWRRNPADVMVLDRRPDFTGSGGANAEYGWFQWPPRGPRGQIFRHGDFE